MPALENKQHTRKLGFLDNSHRFLREAADKGRLAGDNPDQWMFAVAALVQSVELALKAALAEIHPVLIYESIDNPKRTVTIAAATSRLKSPEMGKMIFSEKDEIRLKRAIKIRNDLTHSDFSVNLAQIEANFHEVFAFLAEFNRRSFNINIENIVEPAQLVAFLENRKHHREMLERALTRINDEEIEPHLLRSCSYCTEDTCVEDIDEFRCYLCHHSEEIFQCQRCVENFSYDELEDFSDSFDIDFSEGRAEIWGNYGFEDHRACKVCAAEIRQEIHEAKQAYYYDQMMEDEYMNRYGEN
jgi:hypothetical protein